VALVRSNPLRLVEPFLHPGVQSAVATAPDEAVRIRRCTFRLISISGGDVRVGTGTRYEVSCRYPDLEMSTPLGDMAAARAICANCSAKGIFRPDED
jgi:hypothetical protein